MRKKHVSLDADMVTFDFTAKSGKRRIQSVADPDVVAVVRELKERKGGGYELLAYRCPDRSSGWADIKSADINAWIKQQTGGDFSAKDFRTWSATVLASVALAVSGAVKSQTGKKRAVTRAVKEVAGYLGNTPAVARSSYIDPRVIDRYMEGRTIGAAVLGQLGEQAGPGALSTQGAVEAAVLDLLDEREQANDTQNVDELAA
jgi:DNA topoisomerase IB